MSKRAAGTRSSDNGNSSAPGVSTLPVKWIEYRIDEIGTIVTGKTPTTRETAYFGGEVPFVTPTDMDGRKYISRTQRSLTEKGADSVRGAKIPSGAVMVSCIGSDMGKVAIAGKDCVTNQQINSIIPSDEATREFVYYALLPRKRELQALAGGGSAQPILNKGHFSTIRILMPDLPSRSKIVEILKFLDDKIEINRRMNETLEAMARAIFKSWFVDFDPVRAKMEGRRPAGMDAATSGLFPDSFQDSPLGKIPKGWTVTELGQIAEIIDCLHSKKPVRQNAGLPLLQLWNIADAGMIDMSDPYWITEEDYLKWISRMEAKAGDCVITNVGRVGAVGQIPTGLSAALGRNMTGIRCKTEFQFPTFLVRALLSDEMTEEIERRKDTGTILDALNVRNIPLLRVALAPLPVIEAFEEITRPLRAKMESNAKESTCLAAIRDTLLPKLMTGEIAINAS